MKDFLVVNSVSAEYILLEELPYGHYVDAFFFTRRNYSDPPGIKMVSVNSNIFHLPLVSHYFHHVWKALFNLK